MRSVAAVPISQGRPQRSVALRPFVLPGPSNGAFPAVSSAVELWDVADDSLVATVTPPGKLLGFGLGNDVLAVTIVDPTGTQHLIRYDASTGTKIASTPLGSPTTNFPVVSGHTIAYSIGRRIMVQNATTGAIRTVYTAGVTPTELSTDGTHVYWVADGHVIRSIAL